ncbi:MAG: TonB-dependent receptor plug domain-containing protein [Bacteroidales bacterium]|nr:TonB-dependent receptor plug domain-containing protein [Bacteroidales bacterium]
MEKTLRLIAIAFTATALLSACGTASYVPSDTDDDGYETGYGTIDQSENTHSINKIKPGKEITSYKNIYDYLVGRVPGVQVSPSGQISIRGAVTRVGELLEPMFVVDGSETEDISTINPNDIYSVDVLKDGSAAWYGMRGAGGVIVITTKAGRMAAQQNRKSKSKSADTDK